MSCAWIVICLLFITWNVAKCQTASVRWNAQNSFAATPPTAFCCAVYGLLPCERPSFGLRLAVFWPCDGRHLALCLPSSCLVFAVILPCDGRRLPFLSPLQLHMLTAFSINSLCSRCLCLHTFPGLIFVRCAIILRQRPSLHSLGIIV